MIMNTYNKHAHSSQVKFLNNNGYRATMIYPPLHKSSLQRTSSVIFQYRQNLTILLRNEILLTFPMCMGNVRFQFTKKN